MSEAFDLNWLVSVDDHVLEPPHVWQDRVPSKYKDIAPKIVRKDGQEFWTYEDKRVSTLGLAAVAGLSKEQFTLDSVSYADMRPGCYDPVARLEDMDRAGILASMCFPSFTRFCGQVFYEAKDKELAMICVQAYNDWMIDEWCGSAPGRYIPLIIIPLWDPRSAAKEIERCAAKGARALCFSENPVPLGLPSIHDAGRYWDPVWQAAQDTQMIVCMHQGSSSTRMRMGEDSPELSSMSWAIGAQSSGTLLDWLFGPVFVRFPGIKIALSEGGIGWIPYFLERAEQVLDKQRFWASDGDVRYDLASGKVKNVGELEVDLMTLDLRAVFREHVYGCFIDDVTGVQNLQAIGVDNVMIETDYPHSDSTWPTCIDFARKQLDGLDEKTQYAILRGNAERVFRFKAYK
ncbi:amidohydrolase [Nocardioides sp. Root190]|uniref:amidohydrolase family protein n=1 Tax=Nocardioides sp. Root190 TaxID=1736488 RepID=UPI0006FB0F7C|nr:amidohydrolase family protein [Nocardioides sp. Root190]KRB75145.1 amidohydrolase [Nocardioides sp. Root190]